VAIFGATGIALNLADKAEAQGIKAMRVKKAEPAQPSGPAIMTGTRPQ
jgi:hypothetical protein